MFEPIEGQNAED